MSNNSNTGSVEVSSSTELDALLGSIASEQAKGKAQKAAPPKSELPRGRPPTFAMPLAAAIIARKGAMQTGGVSEKLLRAATGWSDSTLAVQVSHMRKEFGAAVSKLSALGVYVVGDGDALAAAVREHCEQFSDQPMTDESKAALARVFAVLDA